MSSLISKIVATMMRLRTPQQHSKASYNTLRNKSLHNTSFDERNIVQRYWPCFAIISCAILFSLIFYTTVFMTEDSEYPICTLPESLLLPTEDQTYLTYIYPRDVSNLHSKINNKFSQNEKNIFLSTLKQLYNEQQQTINLIHHKKNAQSNMKYRVIKDCNLKFLKKTSHPNHCVKFHLVFAANRANKDSGHKKIRLYQDGIVHPYDESNEGFNFHKVDSNELLMAISLKAHDFDIAKNKKFFLEMRKFLGLNNNELNNMISDESIGYFGCVNWHKTRVYDGFHGVFLNKYAIGNYSGLLVPNFWENHGQFLSFEALLIGVQFLNLFPMDSGMRIGFNSIGAFASVNHLHFQFWSIGGMDDNKLPIENAPIIKLGAKGMGRIQINEVDGDFYPIHALQYEVNLDKVNADNVLYSDLEHLARCIYFCVEHLHRNDIAYNLIMIPGFPFRVFLMPRQMESRFDDFEEFKITPGFPELSGNLMLIDEDDWNELTVEKIWTVWKERISINDDKEWMEITRECLMMDM